MTYTFIIHCGTHIEPDAFPLMTINIAAESFEEAKKQLPTYIKNYRHD